MLAIEIQAETLAVRAHQIVRLFVRRFLLVPHGTPTHTVTQTMLAEHQHGIGRRTLLEGRGYLHHPVMTVEPGSTLVHHIAQVSEFALRKGVRGGGHGHDFLAIVHPAGSQELLHRLATKLRQLGRRDEPVVLQIDIDADGLERRVAQLA